jgi:hypothetical protein
VRSRGRTGPGRRRGDLPTVSPRSDEVLTRSRRPPVPGGIRRDDPGQSSSIRRATVRSIRRMTLRFPQTSGWNPLRSITRAPALCVRSREHASTISPGLDSQASGEGHRFTGFSGRRAASVSTSFARKVLRKSTCRSSIRPKCNACRRNGELEGARSVTADEDRCSMAGPPTATRRQRDDPPSIVPQPGNNPRFSRSRPWRMIDPRPWPGFQAHSSRNAQWRV